MKFNALAAKQFIWVENMGWHNKTVLESLALIASEIGEAMDEAFGEKPTEHFGSELADIVLRILDLAHDKKIDLDNYLEKTTVVWKTDYTMGNLAEITVALAKWSNTARKKELQEDFSIAMAIVVKQVEELAIKTQVNLEHEIVTKMAINDQRGTRGRII